MVAVDYLDALSALINRDPFRPGRDRPTPGPIDAANSLGRTATNNHNFLPAANFEAK